MADVTINLAVAGTEVVTGALRRVGEVAIDALGAAFKVVGDFAANSFKGALEAQAGIDTFNAALTRAGENAPITADAAMELSQSLKNLTGGSDDTILAMETVGLTFNKIGKDIFPKFITSSADLAAKLKMGPEQAAQLLGKTLQDLSTDGTASIGRLRAAGLTLTDDQEALIKKLVETGDAAGAQQVLLDALAVTTGGAAANAANTLQGKWDIFKETIADAGEGIAAKFIPVLTMLSDTILPPVTEFITRLANQLSIVAGVIANGGWETLFTAFEDGSSYLGSFLELLGLTEDQANATAATFFEFAGSFGIIEGAGLQLVKAFQASWPMIQAAVSDALTYIQGLIGTIMPTIVSNTADSLNSLREFWTAHGEQIMAAVDFAFKVIAATIGTALTLISGIISVALNLLNGDWDGAWFAIQKTLKTVMDGILGIVGTNLDEFLNTWRTVLSQLFVIVQEGLRRATQAARDLIEGFKQVGLDIMRGLSDGLNEGIGWVKDAAISAVQGAIDAAKHLLGIHSPSTVFAGIGENTMAGMAQGIAGASYMPAQAAAGAAQQTAQSTVNNMGGNTYNYYGVSADMNAAYTRALAGAF